MQPVAEKEKLEASEDIRSPAPAPPENEAADDGSLAPAPPGSVTTGDLSKGSD